MPPTRYSYDIDLDNLNTSHAVGILSVPPGNRVLDVGAADGSVARLLTGRGCRVWGIEVDETAARAAATICQRVFIRDVEHTELDAELEATPFDTILFLDILEHLRDPLALLKRAQRWLEPHGQIIASIPNVTHGAVRLNLLKGNFTYTDTGLLDRTHLHFFDRMAVEALFDAAGLQVRDRLRITRAITETEIPIDLESFPATVVAEVMADPDATTFQFVVVASLKNGDAPHRTSESLASRLQRRVDTLEHELQALRESLRKVETDHQSQAAAQSALASRYKDDAARLGELTSELTLRMDELHQRDREVRYLTKSVAVKEAFITELRADVDTLESRGRADAAVAKAHREFVASTGVQMLLHASQRLRRLPRMRRGLHRLLGHKPPVEDTRGPAEADVTVPGDDPLARVAAHWAAHAGTWQIGRGVHWLEHSQVQERVNFKVTGRRGIDRYEVLRQNVSRADAS